MIFGEIAGHAREKELLERALRAGRVAHAYLFAGPRGIGKKTLAMAFAKALNCSAAGQGGAGGTDGEGEGAGYCGACRDCLAIDSGNHENVIVVQPLDKDGAPSEQGIIRIDRVRDVIAALRFSAQGGRRVVVVDGAERLQPEAANAMLKTLEEPPPGAVIILISSMTRLLLPTIISRCQLLGFRPLSAAEVEDFLVRTRGVDPGDALLWARFSEGSVARALSCGDSKAMEKRREVLEGMRAALKGGEKAVLDMAYDLSREADLDGILEFMKSWCRDLALCAEGLERLMVNVDLRDLMGSGPPLRDVLEMYEKIEAARAAIAPPRYANKQLAMETLLMDMAGAGLFA